MWATKGQHHALGFAMLGCSFIQAAAGVVQSTAGVETAFRLHVQPTRVTPHVVLQRKQGVNATQATLETAAGVIHGSSIQPEFKASPLPTGLA